MAFHRFCRAAIEDNEITVYGDGTQTRDFTYVADAVAATKAAATAELKTGGIYNIGGGSRASVNETLDIIGDLAGRELNVNRIEVQQGDVRDTGAATERAAADLGFAPSTTVADGLAAEYAWVNDLLAAEALG
jgi:nucleoside-diphosphate-sugar epimerase